MVLGAPISGLAAGLAFDGSTSGPVTMKSPLIIRRVSVVIDAFPSPPSASRFTAGAAGFLNLSQSGDLARGHATAVLPAATMKVPPPYAGHGDFLRPNTKPAEHRGRWGSVRLERISRVAQ